MKSSGFYLVGFAVSLIFVAIYYFVNHHFYLKSFSTAVLAIFFTVSLFFFVLSKSVLLTNNQSFLSIAIIAFSLKVVLLGTLLIYLVTQRSVNHSFILLYMLFYILQSTLATVFLPRKAEK